MFATPMLVFVGGMAMIIPITIHFFFKRRKKQVDWAAMDLLMQAIRQTTRRRHLEKITLLILRCLVVLFAGLAIAGPLIQNEQRGTNNSKPQKELVLILDDGISQQTHIGDIDAFSSCRTKAVSAINQLQAGDRVGLVLAAGARPLVWPPSTDLAAAKSILNNTQVSDAPSDIGGAIDVAHDSSISPIVLSDFRRGSLVHQTIQTAATAPKDEPRIFVTPPNQTDVSNTQIVSFEPQARGPLSLHDGIPVRVKARREGGRLSVDHSQIEIVSDDNTKSSLRIDWSEGQVEGAVDGTINIQANRQTETALRASLLQDDAQPADNVRFLFVSTTNTIRVGIVDRVSVSGVGQPTENETGVGTWVENALRPRDDVGIETEVIEPTAINTQRCKGLDAIVVVRPDAVDATGWTVLAQNIKLGLVVVITPPPQAMNSGWSDGFLRAFDLGWSVAHDVTKSEPPMTVRRSDIPHPLLLQISSELPDLIQPIGVNRWFAISVPVNHGDVVLELGDGSPLIVRGSNEGSRGSVVLFATPPDLGWTNIPAKPIMVPLFQELIRQSIAQVDRGRKMNVGSDRMPTTISGVVGLRLMVGRAGVIDINQTVISVDPNGTLAQPISSPGVYAAVDSTNRTMGWVVANIDPMAATTQPTSIEEISAEFKGFSVQINKNDIATDIASGALNTTQTRGVPGRTQQDIPIARALQGESLAVWFFSSLLFLLIIETWVARHSSIGSIKQSVVGESK